MGNPSFNFLKVDRAKWAKRSSYTGVFLVFLTRSFPWYLGNLTVYTESYFRHLLGPDPEITMPWSLSLWIVGTGIGQIVAGYIARLIGRKWTMILASVIMDSGLFLSALSVQHCMISLDLSLGLAGGLGMGLMFTLGLQHALSFRPKYPGMVAAFVMSGNVVGGVFFNQLITWYINPTNVSPDLLESLQKYFTQKEVLDKVPSTFLVLGVAHLCCHAIGISLMKPNVDEELEDRRDFITNQEDVDSEGGGDKPQEVANGHISSRNSTEPPEKDEVSLARNVSLRQVLTSWTFYVLWTTAFCSHYGYIVFANFFKIYGQTQIPDDQFFTYLAICMLLASLPFRMLWGGLIDRCGVKFSLMIFSCIMSVFSNFWYFTPIINRWLYFVWTMMFGCITCAFSLIFSVATLKLFGNEHFSKNFGAVMSSTIVISLLAPTITQALVTAYGWFYLFFSVGCANFVALVLVVVLRMKG